MFCKQYSEAIQEFADGTLGPVRRAELQTHLEQCDECRALLADLRKIREAAAALEQPAPPDRVWLQIAGRLRQEGRVAQPASRGGRRMALLAIAAALVLMVGGSLWFLYPMRQAANNSVAQSTTNPGATEPRSQGGGNAAQSDTVQSIADDLMVAERHYQAAIGKLEQAAKVNDGAIDAQTAGVLRKNLQVIDQAIAESRTALNKEPQSQPARDSLFEALRRKVSLLQDTIALMNEMRKGNSAGAAQLIGDPNKS